MNILLNELEMTYKNGLAYKYNTSYDEKINIEKFRIFPDMTTDMFVKTFYDSEQSLYAFVDYTFHALYSELVKKVTLDIMNYNKCNKHTHVLPICGSEGYYMIFKGGTLMNYYYKILTCFNKKNKKIDDVRAVGGPLITNYTFDIQANREIRTIQNTFTDFLDKLITKNFSISDIDYSVFIVTNSEDRHMILQKFILQILATKFSSITAQFDEYFVDSQNDETIENSHVTNLDTSSSIITSNTPSILLLHGLRAIVGNDKHRQDIKKSLNVEQFINTLEYNDEHDIDIINKIRNLLSSIIISNERDILLLYNCCDIVTLIIYLFNLSVNTIHNITNLNFFMYNLKQINKQIDRLIVNKWNYLRSVQFYSQEKIRNFVDTLIQKYNDILENKAKHINYFNDKKTIYITPEKDPIYKEITHKLNDAHPPLTKNDIMFKRRNNLVMVSNNNPLRYSLIKNSDNVPDSTLHDLDAVTGKIHYITYNSMIKKEYLFSGKILNFDLLRSKFNVVLSEGIILKNNNQVEVSIPSEFIDISILRYNDFSNIAFAKHIKEHNNIPTIMYHTVKRKQICLFVYSSEDIVTDLENVIGMNAINIQPWLQNKYEKRIIRLITFIVLNTFRNSEPRLSQTNLYNFLNLCRYIYEYINNPDNSVDDVQQSFDATIFSKFIYSSNSDNKNEFVKFYHKNIVSIIMNSAKLETCVIAPEYQSIDFLINVLFIWSSVYFEQDIIILELTKFIAKKQLHELIYDITKINAIRQNFNTFVKTLYDYGFKLYCELSE